MPCAPASRSRICAALPYLSSRSIAASRPSSKLCTPTDRRVTPASRNRRSVGGCRWFGFVSIEIDRTGHSERSVSSVSTSSSGLTVGVPPPT